MICKIRRMLYKCCSRQKSIRVADYLTTAFFGVVVLIVAASWFGEILKQTPAVLVDVEDADSVNFEDLQKDIISGKAILVDLRNESSYKASHAPEALSYPIQSVVSGIKPDFGSSVKIYVYCEGIEMFKDTGDGLVKFVTNDDTKIKKNPETWGKNDSNSENESVNCSDYGARILSTVSNEAVSLGSIDDVKNMIGDDGFTTDTAVQSRIAQNLKLNLEHEKMLVNWYALLTEEQGYDIYQQISAIHDKNEAEILDEVEARGISDPRSPVYGAFEHQEVQKKYIALKKLLKTDEVDYLEESVDLERAQNERTETLLELLNLQKDNAVLDNMILTNTANTISENYYNVKTLAGLIDSRGQNEAILLLQKQKKSFKD